MLRRAFLKTLALFLAQKPGLPLPGFLGQQHNAPVVNIGSPSPSSGVAGTVVIEWDVTYTGTVTSSDITGKVSTTGTTAEGTFTLINPTSSTPTIRFTSSDGNGGTARVLMLVNAAYNGSVGSAQTPWATYATTSATPPIVTIGSPSPSSGEEGSAVIDWDVSYSTWADAYNFTLSDLTVNVTGTVVASNTDPPFEIIDGTTSTPVVRFTSGSGYGTIGFDVLAGACQSDSVNNTASSPSTTAEITEDGGK